MSNPGIYTTLKEYFKTYPHSTPSAALKACKLPYTKSNLNIAKVAKYRVRGSRSRHADCDRFMVHRPFVRVQVDPSWWSLFLKGGGKIFYSGKGRHTEVLSFRDDEGFFGYQLHKSGALCIRLNLDFKIGLKRLSDHLVGFLGDAKTAWVLHCLSMGLDSAHYAVKVDGVADKVGKVNFKIPGLGMLKVGDDTPWSGSTVEVEVDTSKLNNRLDEFNSAIENLLRGSITQQQAFNQLLKMVLDQQKTIEELKMGFWGKFTRWFKSKVLNRFLSTGIRHGQ